ncbi:hypothetical protein ANN_24422 [Periplaneta americana]|uniref:Mos1 transposase HTH domain-containing protein n=1 Tax=Periplaneta americana TaxID=6978 RepID=A0ABQ8S3D6_PERAM|nr:hypothetical protein ANN_24422 [Periplaneta americana]
MSPGSSTESYLAFARNPRKKPEPEDGMSSDKREEFRHIILFEFNRGAKAAEAARNICAVYQENSIGENIERKWFFRFNTQYPCKICARIWLQHDEAPAHFSLAERQQLTADWLSRSGPMASNVTNFKPLESLWGHLKTLLYVIPVDHVDDLPRIVDARNTIRVKPGTFEQRCGRHDFLNNVLRGKKQMRITSDKSINANLKQKIKWKLKKSRMWIREFCIQENGNQRNRENMYGMWIRENGSSGMRIRENVRESIIIIIIITILHLT